jgi:hypothetical protein
MYCIPMITTGCCFQIFIFYASHQSRKRICRKIIFHVVVQREILKKCSTTLVVCPPYPRSRGTPRGRRRARGRRRWCSRMRSRTLRGRVQARGDAACMAVPGVGGGASTPARAPSPSARAARPRWGWETIARRRRTSAWLALGVRGAARDAIRAGVSAGARQQRGVDSEHGFRTRAHHAEDLLALALAALFGEESREIGFWRDPQPRVFAHEFHQSSSTRRFLRLLLKFTCVCLADASGWTAQPCALCNYVVTTGKLMKRRRQGSSESQREATRFLRTPPRAECWEGPAAWPECSQTGHHPP